MTPVQFVNLLWPCPWKIHLEGDGSRIYLKNANDVLLLEILSSNRPDENRALAEFLVKISEQYAEGEMT
jgi:hypothetical protein